MSGIGLWKPAQGAHAIQMAAVGINFRDPVTSVLLQNAVAKLAPAAGDLGLHVSNSIMEPVFHLNTGNPGGHSQIAAYEFLRQERPDFFSDKVLLNKSQMRLEDWSYTRWAVLTEKFNKMIHDCYDIYSSANVVSEIYVEYIDIFVAPENSLDSTLLVIDGNSDFVCRGAISDNGLWHSHCGRLDQAANDVQRLRQVNIDSALMQSPEGIKRGIQIRTFASDQIDQLKNPISAELTFPWDDIIGKVQELHDLAKMDFGKILTQAASEAVSLG